MQIRHLTPLLLLIPMALAHAGVSGSSRMEQSCNNYPTPDARAECEKKNREVMTAFDKEKKAEKKDAKGGSPKKKNDMCFTRKATGEVVCPN